MIYSSHKYVFWSIKNGLKLVILQLLNYASVELLVCFFFFLNYLLDESFQTCKFWGGFLFGFCGFFVVVFCLGFFICLFVFDEALNSFC